MVQLVVSEIQHLTATPRCVYLVEGEKTTARQLVTYPEKYDSCKVPHPDTQMRHGIVNVSENSLECQIEFNDTLHHLPSGLPQLFKHITVNGSNKAFFCKLIDIIASSPVLTKAERAVLGDLLASRMKLTPTVVTGLIQERYENELQPEKV